METGREVRPRRAREAFCRCEQAWARRTSDIMMNQPVNLEGPSGRRVCAQVLWLWGKVRFWDGFEDLSDEVVAGTEIWLLY